MKKIIMMTLGLIAFVGTGNIYAQSGCEQKNTYKVDERVVESMVRMGILSNVELIDVSSNLVELDVDGEAVEVKMTSVADTSNGMNAIGHVTLKDGTVLNVKRTPVSEKIEVGIETPFSDIVGDTRIEIDVKSSCKA